MRKYVLFITVAFMVSSACKPSGPKLEPLDMLQYGIPLKIMAPAGAVVDASDLGIMKDITIKDDAKYSIQIFETETDETSASAIVSTLKETISSSEFFDGYVKEEPDGFVFKKRIDETYINYDFRHVKVLGAKRYVIQAGLSNQYTEDEVVDLYNSVK